MDDIFMTAFQTHRHHLSLEIPSDIIRRVEKDDSLVFFGGENWSRVESDLLGIPQGERPRFVWGLFLMVVTDQNLHEPALASHYPQWRSVTRLPKLGWCGMGPHYENAIWLLRAPEEKGVVDTAEMLALSPRLLDSWSRQVQTLSDRWTAGDTRTYFDVLRKDRQWSTIGRGRVFKALRKALDERLVLLDAE